MAGSTKTSCTAGRSCSANASNTKGNNTLLLRRHLWLQVPKRNTKSCWGRTKSPEPHSWISWPREAYFCMEFTCCWGAASTEPPAGRRTRCHGCWCRAGGAGTCGKAATKSNAPWIICRVLSSRCTKGRNPSANTPVAGQQLLAVPEPSPRFPAVSRLCSSAAAALCSCRRK